MLSNVERLEDGGDTTITGTGHRRIRGGGMNTPFRRVILALTAFLGLYVGVWAEFFPRSFYASFPGLGLHWVSMNGAYDEHLIRDVGSFYLALTATSIAGIIARTAVPGRVAGLGWTVFGVFHFGYHITHLTGSAADIAGNVISLGLSALLGIVLLLPARAPAAVTEAPG